MNGEAPISIRNLSVHYGDLQVLKDVNLDIPARKITVIIGPSGCAKTTLLKSLNRLLDTAEGVRVRGQVVLDGENIYDPRTEVTRVRRKMGLLSAEAPGPADVDLRERRPRPAHPRLRSKAELGRRVEHYLRVAGLWDEVKDRLREPASGLSVGQRQRLCLARGLAVEPEAVVFYYSPPRCLRLLDPEIDSMNNMIPDDSLLRDAALLSSTAPVLAKSTVRMPRIYQPEPAHGWCYYFQKADLARQSGDWETVAKLGDSAFVLDDYPNDPLERFVYIEGYAHTGDWQKAVKLSQDSYKVSRNYVAPLLCRLWARIARETDNTLEKKSALYTVRAEFECPP